MIHPMSHFRFLALLFAVLLAPIGATAAELVMAEQEGCEWCEAWDEEVGTIYHKTDAGRIAPLRRVNIHDPLPREFSFIRGLAFTPTFVLVHEGKEIGRILGYPGEDFFWGLLEELIRQLPREEKWNARSRPTSEKPPSSRRRSALRG